MNRGPELPKTLNENSGQSRITRLKYLYICRILISDEVKGLYTIGLLVLSNTFMTLAWYGHLRFRDMKWFAGLPLLIIILLSWGIALFEYFFQVPANRIGFRENGGPFTLVQLKVIQEVITLITFTVFTLIAFRNETLRWNHFVGFLFLVLAVYFIFRK